jgi:hypothetical protein
MKKSDVVIGQTYAMHHTSGYIHVRILRTVERTTSHVFNANNIYNRCMTHWRALNLKTNREIEVKSAAKLHHLTPVTSKP